MTDRQRNIIGRCGEECVACLRIAARCAARGMLADAARFFEYAAEWSARAFEEVQA